MLVISRKRNESVLVGDDIVVTVVDIRGSTVRLAITAPEHIAIDRPEVRARKLENARYADADSYNPDAEDDRSC